jgi:hypothetical protein
MRRRSGPILSAVDARQSIHLRFGNGTERHDPFHFSFRDLAAALVALELLFGGRLLVAMA